jgi:hypothetical protein
MMGNRGFQVCNIVDASLAAYEPERRGTALDAAIATLRCLSRYIDHMNASMSTAIHPGSRLAEDTWSSEKVLRYISTSITSVDVMIIRPKRA